MSRRAPCTTRPAQARQRPPGVRRAAGQPAGELRAGEYATGRAHLATAAFAAYEELAERHALVVAEGAGSPAEINLRRGDYVNMGLARRFDLPVMVVGDIDRGGILAALFGTWALLDEDDRALLKAFCINKFRGDESVLTPGLEEITRRTGVPFIGVLPWLEDVWLDSGTPSRSDAGARRRTGSSTACQSPSSASRGRRMPRMWTPWRPSPASTCG